MEVASLDILIAALMEISATTATPRMSLYFTPRTIRPTLVSTDQSKTVLRLNGVLNFTIKKK